jgi:hypothetical protein
LSQAASGWTAARNWSRDETTLLTGGYEALAPYLERLDVTQLVLE